VFVSHDRYFIDKLATRVFEVGEGQVHVFPGNYEDYLWRKQGGAAVVASATAAPNGTQPRAAVPHVPEEVDSKQKRVNPIKLKQMKERCVEIEEEISRLEAGIAECENALTSFVSTAETARQTELLRTQRSQLEQLMKEWEEVSAVVENT
ncbi:MAG: transporter related, partial [Acidobacteriaceae bacterium]|nr:transporter related [Acidobacteriaceae bacterium]